MAEPPASLDPAQRLPDFAARLEEAFDAISDTWWKLGKRLGGDPTAILAHSPACATNASDLGLMLAWTRLVQTWTVAPATVLVICDDPWVFRHLARLQVVTAGKPPALWPTELRFLVRGFFARCKVAATVALAALRLRRHRKVIPRGAPTLLVYGHPTSTAEGADGYFGNLMKEMPALVRMLHVDCGTARARGLADDGRTFSLHAWGGLLAALGLVFARWRPRPEQREGPYGWLVRRAAAVEGGTGQAARMRWQSICQQAWLEEARPRVVAWPWENHSWERGFVRHARAAGVKTVGYQHTTVGKREWNYSAASNPDGLDSVPDRILTSGPAGLTKLLRLGYAAERLTIAGALRMRAVHALPRDSKGPVFVALPFDNDVAGQMVAALRPLGRKGRRFLIKDHPMTPFPFEESPGVTRCSTPLDQQTAVAAVIYAATTVGLEALLGGLPTLRFQPRNRVPADAIPEDLAVPAATAESLEEALQALEVPQSVAPESVFSRPRMDVWKAVLCETETAPLDGGMISGGLCPGGAE